MDPDDLSRAQALRQLLATVEYPTHADVVAVWVARMQACRRLVRPWWRRWGRNG